MRSTAQAILLWYARNVPYRRGKQRLSERMRRIFEFSYLFCEQQKIDRLDLIKLDIEGAELKEPSFAR
jgi:hypothetical protein